MPCIRSFQSERSWLAVVGVVGGGGRLLVLPVIEGISYIWMIMKIRLGSAGSLGVVYPVLVYICWYYH